MIIDKRLGKAAAVFLVTAALTLFGFIHSPLPGSQIFLPFGPASWSSMVLDDQYQWQVMEFVYAYLACAVTLYLWQLLQKNSPLSETEITESQ